MAAIGGILMWRSFAATSGNIADINGDGKVDIQDLAALLINFGKSGSGLKGDLNGDSRVNIQDLSLLLINFGYVAPASTVTPDISQDIIVSGYSHIWEVAWLPTGEMIFDERDGGMHLYKNGSVSEVQAPADVQAESEGGLLGLAVDPQFSQNRYIYACFDTTANDIRIVRWVFSTDLKTLSSRKDIVTGIQQNHTGGGNTGVHSGCRIKFGPDGYLGASTGDAYTTGNAQSHTIINGKILRVDRDGNAAPGNLGGDFDPRIYSYGHRNPQGIAFFPRAKNGVLGVSVEHGPDCDDEVNLLVKGQFGWDPGPNYEDDGQSMTNKGEFPDAIDAIWSSGCPTQATSGGSIITGAQWKGWDGALAIGTLKESSQSHLLVLRLDASNKVTKEEHILTGVYGRIRTADMGPDGNLYITTDEGSNDKIVKLTPH